MIWLLQKHLAYILRITAHYVAKSMCNPGSDTLGQGAKIWFSQFFLSWHHPTTLGWTGTPYRPTSVPEMTNSVPCKLCSQAPKSCGKPSQKSGGCKSSIPMLLVLKLNVQQSQTGVVFIVHILLFVHIFLAYTSFIKKHYLFFRGISNSLLSGPMNRKRYVVRMSTDNRGCTYMQKRTTYKNSKSTTRNHHRFCIKDVTKLQNTFDLNKTLPLSNSSNSTSCCTNSNKSYPCQELSLWVSPFTVMNCSSWVMICQNWEI